jgi:hypothetical protein
MKKAPISALTDVFLTGIECSTTERFVKGTGKEKPSPVSRLHDLPPLLEVSLCLEASDS